MQKTWTVYMHKNKTNGKVYIGITCQDPKKRWCGGKHYEGNKHFTSAIEKYGWDGFEHIILHDNIASEHEATELEEELINQYNALNPAKGYNILPGGSGYHTGYKMTSEHKRHMMESLEKFKNSEGYEEWLSKHKAEASENARRNWLNHREEIMKKSSITRKKRKDTLMQKLICRIEISNSQYWGRGVPYVYKIYINIYAVDKESDYILKIAKRVTRKVEKGEANIFQDKENRWAFAEDCLKIFDNFNPIVKYDATKKEMVKVYKGVMEIAKKERPRILRAIEGENIVNKKYQWFFLKDYVEN